MYNCNDLIEDLKATYIEEMKKANNKNDDEQ